MIPTTREEAFELLNKELEALKLPKLQSNASKNDVTKAYRDLALKWHPDKWSNKSQEEQKKATEKFKEISVAHGILTGKISEQFISAQSSDDWVDILVKKFKDYINELNKKRTDHTLMKKRSIYFVLFMLKT